MSCVLDLSTTSTVSASESAMVNIVVPCWDEMASTRGTTQSHPDEEGEYYLGINRIKPSALVYMGK